MYAIIETGGKQYKVESGDVIDIERISTGSDSNFTFDKVLAIAGDKDLKVGDPYLKNASVSATLVDEFKDKKVVVFKMKRRKGYRRKQGHRQALSRVKILDIAQPK